MGYCPECKEKKENRKLEHPKHETGTKASKKNKPQKRPIEEDNVVNKHYRKILIIIIILAIIIWIYLNNLPDTQIHQQEQITPPIKPTETSVYGPRLTNETTQTIIQAILAYDSYDNQQITITGGYELPEKNTIWNGYITDTQGNKLPFKTNSNRGFNEAKQYTYTGNITITNNTKYLKITGSIENV